METTKEDVRFLEKLRPPRLEDAGLEDCALPPDSIKEAFFKAATAVSSRVGSLLSGDADESDGECLNDPLPGERSPPPPPDALVGVEPVADAPGPCAAKKGGALIGDDEHGADLLGGGSPAGEEDVVVVPAGEERGGGDAACVDGMKGLSIGEKKDNGDDEGGEGPTLVEGYLV